MSDGDCFCDCCQHTFCVDINLSDAEWQRLIAPNSWNMLCPRCIADLLERQHRDTYGAFRLTRLP